jgi:O-antigen ligase
MASNQFSKFNSFQLFSPIFIILYLCIGFIPNLEAVDKIAPQWVGMTLINLLSVFTIFYYRKGLTKPIYFSLSSLMSLTYILFIIWAGLSYFYAINPTEVLVNITRQVNVLIMYICMAILLYNMKQKNLFISWVITFILGIEIYAVLDQAIGMINSSGIITPGELKGVTANRNITAFSIAIKIPFVLYLIHKLNKIKYKAVLSFLIFLALFSLSMIQSRASFIALGLIFIGYVALNLYIYFFSKKELSKILSIGYFVLPLILAVILNQAIIANKGADAISRAATISISTQDGSVNQRLRYYEDVFTHMKSNPLLGTGLGNWKLKSIEYDSKDIVGYVVPYHAHSDFIQLGAELGFLGFLLYLGIFLLAIYYAYKIIRYSKTPLEEKVFVFLLVVALAVYGVDANLNFPIARPQVLVVWTAIMSLVMIFYQKYKQQNKSQEPNIKLNQLFLLLSITILLPSFFITNSVYKSLKGQMFLLQDFNSNQYNIPLNQLENLVPEIPNITVTTIPINSVKARYFVNAKQYDRALDLIRKGSGANPYLFYSEILKSEIFQKQGKLDSAKVNAKKAFFGLPNNDLHSSRYINLINLTGDKQALDEAFELLTQKNNLNNWKNYLLVASNINAGMSDPILNERAKKAIEIFPYNNDIRGLYNRILIGENGLNDSVKFSKRGLEFFNNQDYSNAAMEFENAISSNPLDYSHYENAATANYMLGNLEKALEQINEVINNLNPLNGKCEYIKALIFIKMGDPIGACPLLETSRDSGFSQAKASFDQYCRYR